MIPQSISSKLTDLQAAELIINGLAICSFNDGEKLWEVAYPRQMLHELTITTQLLDNTGMPVAAPIPHPVGGSVRSFAISLTTGGRAHEVVFPLGGPAAANFVRTAPNNDPHDLGWMIDITGVEPGHNFNRLLPRAESEIDVTLARFPNSVFFTTKISDRPARLSPREDDDPEGPRSRELGFTNEAIGGVLLATGNGEIRFESEPAGSLNIAPLQYDEDHRYAISIINDDTQAGVRRGRFVRGDFHFFYDIIQVDGVQQELWAEPNPHALSNSSHGDCDPVGARRSALLNALL